MNGCGGTLIGPDIVLGAAHCGGYVGSKVTIGTTRVEVIQQSRHPNYNSNTEENDFYLYRLKSSVSTTGATVTLNTDGATPSAGQPLTTLGKGHTSEGGSSSSVLRDVVVPTVSNDGCRSAYGSRYKSNVMLCAGEASKDSCQGDSGGPLVIRQGMNHILAGVVSWGDGCGRPESPGIYARVSAVIPWIQTVACDGWKSSVNGLCSGSSPVTPPTPAPIVVPTPTARPVASPTSGGCTTLKVTFRTDSWPWENSIVLEDDRSTIWNYVSFKANKRYIYTRCLPTDGCAVLDVTDTEGDGLLGKGSLKVEWGSQVLYNGWDLGYGFYLDLGNGC